VRDLDRGTEAKLTFVSGSARTPVWSPDGRRFACAIRSEGRTTILIGSADGLGALDTLTVPGVDDFWVCQWSAATSKLVCFPQSFQGAFTVATDSARHEVTKLQGLPGVVGQPRISPDGRWLTYVSSEGTTRPQVYVQSLTGVPGRWQISTKEGFAPRWSKAGKELLFEANGSVMSVDVESEGAFRASEPKPLFALPQPTRGPVEYTWDPSDDGQRLMLLVPPHGAKHGSIEVTTDFSRLVNRK
jgi:Tol biopolymer transport system component